MSETTVEMSVADLVSQSYGRAVMKPAFFEEFYNRFTSSSPKIAEMFANTDMTKQKLALRNGIAFLVKFANGSAFAEDIVNGLGRSHRRDNLNVPPSLYPIWVKSLIDTLKTNDSEWDGELEAAWREVLQKGIDRMISLY